MNLINALSIAELNAGGPGSGPNAPCPQCGPHSGSDKHGNVGIKEGDKVKTLKQLSVWNQKTGDIDKFPPGKKVTVLNVLPKVGNADQMLSVKVSKNHDAEYMKMNDVKLHKSVGETITPEPVPQSKVKVSYKSADGAQVTVVKPVQSKEYDPQTLKQLANQPSPFKSSFEKLDKVTPVPKEIEQEYMPEKYEKHTTYIYDSEQKASGTGVTVYVHRYPDHVTVQEQHYTRYSHIDKPLVTWKYDNVEKARQMLQKRYNISIGHKELKKT